MRVLVVDDDAVTAEGLAELLTRAGHHAEWSAHGTSAAERARVLRPAVVVLDCLMPLMDGPAVLRHLRRDSRLPHVAAVAMTASAGDDLLRLAKELPGVRLLRKPFDLRELLDAIDDAAAAAEQAQGGG